MLQIRSLLEENWRPASANRMVAALRGVLRECWHAGLISSDDYQAAISVKAVRGESELRGRDLSAGELRSLFEACARAPQEPSHQQDSGARRRRDAAFLAIAYGSGVRRAEAIALDLADLDFTAGQLRVRRGKGKKPRQAPLAPSAQPAVEDWLQARAICKERGQKAGIQAPAPHDLRRTWVGDLLEFADLATVQRMAGHASVATTARYDRRDHSVQRKAAAQLHVPYVVPED